MEEQSKLRMNLAGALALLMTVAVPLEGQQQFQLTSAKPYGSVVAGGVYVGPYRAQILSAPGMPAMDVYCVDYLNGIKVGDVWDANLSVLSGSLANTRFGVGDPTAVDRYRKAAWLSSQFASTSQSEWGDIHGAIWNIMTPGSPSWAAGDTTAGSWYALAEANFTQVNLDEWVVVTDVNTVNGVGGKQEYLMHVTPEPITMVLFGSGLAGIGLARRRRRTLD